VKFSLRDIERIFPLENTQFKALENAYIIKFQVSSGVIFFNCDNSELKRSSKINFSVAESLGGSGLKQSCRGY